MFRLKAVEELVDTTEQLQWSGILQEYIVDTWTEPAPGDEVNVVMTWSKIGRTAGRIPFNENTVNAAIRLNTGSIAYNMPDTITFDDLTIIDELQLAPCIVAATINSSGAEVQAQVYDYADRAEVVTSNLTGAHTLCCLERQLFNFVKSQVVGDKLTINGLLGVYGWVRGGYGVGMPPAVQYVGNTTVVTIKTLDPLINRILTGPVVRQIVELVPGTREIGLAAEFPFIVADTDGKVITRRIIIDGGVTRMDVTRLSTEAQVMVPKWIDDLYTYFGSPSLVIGPDPTDPVSVSYGITKIPPGSVEAYKVYGRDGNEWVQPDLLDPTTSTNKLWMSLGTNVGVSGMLSDGIIENLEWDFSVSLIGLPIYLGAEGDWSTVAPTVDDNPGEAFRMIGWIESPTTIDFSGRIPGGMLSTLS
jgi:hypothetical protein